MLHFILLCLFPISAYAYIDPGTGSFVLQVVIGAALSGLVALKLFWQDVKSRLQRLLGRQGGDAPPRDGPL